MVDLPEIACPGCGVEVLDIDVKCSECGAPLASTGAQALVGTVVLDQYEVLDILGQGGMSVVYRAKHKLTDQAVALKILPQELAAHSQVKSRLAVRSLPARWCRKCDWSLSSARGGMICANCVPYIAGSLFPLPCYLFAVPGSPIFVIFNSGSR